MDISDRKFFEHPDPQDPSRMDRWYCCPCCGYPTLGAPWNYEFCDMCDWFDDGVNDGSVTRITLPNARQNFAKYRTIDPPEKQNVNTHDDRVVALREQLIVLFEDYMRADPTRRSAISQEIRRLQDLI